MKNTWGGARKGSGPKKPLPEMQKKNVTFYITQKEKEELKRHLKKIRGCEKIESLKLKDDQDNIQEFKKVFI